MPNEFHLSLLTGLRFVRDEQGLWHTEADENEPVEDPTIKAVASRLPAAPHRAGLSDLFNAAAKSVLPLFRGRPNTTSSLFEPLTNDSAKDNSPVEGPDHEAHLLSLFRQSDDLRLLGLQGGSYDRLQEVSSYVSSLNPFIRPKFEAYSTIALAQSHLASGDLDTARSVLVGGLQGDSRIAAMLRAVEGAYAVRQSERIIQVVSAAALIAQKRVGGFENWASDGHRRGDIVTGLQSWAQNYRRLVEEGMPPLEAFERMKFWVRDLEHVGQVMNEENLWSVVGEIGSMNIASIPRPEERMAFTMLHVADRLRDHHEGEAAQHLYSVLENSPARDSVRERLSHLDGDLRSGEIRRFLRSFTPWTAERSGDFYGTLITVGTMAASGGIGGLAGRFIAREAASALAGRIVSVATQAGLQPLMSQGLDPIADGTYFTQVSHNAVLMGGLGLGHAAAERIGGGLFTNLGISVSGMTAFDLVTDPRNFDVSPHLLIANSLGNDLIGRASGVAQRGLEVAPNATKILAVASAALAGCDAESVGSTLSIGAFAGLWVLNLAMAAGRVRSLRSEAARRTETITPEIFERVENTLIGVENPEIARGREMASVERIIANLTIQHVRTLTHPRDPQFVAAPDLPMSVQTGPGHIEIVVPTNHAATRYPTFTALRDGIIEHIRGLSREEGLTIDETTVTNANTVAPRIFSLRGPSGEERVTIEISFQSAPSQGREARNIADRTPAIPLHHMAGIAGSTLLLGGCEAPGTPAIVAITAGFLTAAALIGRAFSRHADASEAARRNTAPMDPSTEIQIPNAPTAEQQIRSMTSRWRNVHVIKGADMVRARQDAAELARLRGRMNEQNTDVQIDYIERIAQFWATGDTEIRRTVNDVIQNAGTTLSEPAIQVLCRRLLNVPTSTQAVADLAMFLSPEARVQILEELIGVEGGVAHIFAIPSLVTPALRSQLAEVAALRFLQGRDVSPQDVERFANGATTPYSRSSPLGPLTRIIFSYMEDLRGIPSPENQRVHLRQQSLPSEQIIIRDALLPRM